MDGSVAAAASPLSNVEIKRYGRQLILPEWGVKSQCKVKASSILLVGMGGLGSPAALYLAAAGIGHLGLVDGDVVECSNLHRQVIHSEQTEGVDKVESAECSIRQINSQVKCTTYNTRLTRDNAIDIIKGFDVVLDCTDNPASRYLLNDVCVLTGKPLVSGSALRFEGQLTVYHHGEGPCYRCLFPLPPPQGTVTNCSDGGVIGPVPGIIGTMQAMEALKIASQIGSVLSGRMVLYDGFQGTFRTINLRNKQSDCAVCGVSPRIISLEDYENFCPTCSSGVDVLAMEDRISCSEYKTIVDERKEHHLIDVREEGEFQICHLEHAINIPLKVLQRQKILEISVLSTVFNSLQGHIYVCCRRGNDSQLAVVALRSQLEEIFNDVRTAGSTIIVKDIIGGLTEWNNSIDPSFPIY